MFRNAPWLGPKVPSPAVVPRTMRGETFVQMSLSSPHVLETTKPQPLSKARRQSAAVPVGGAEARPSGFGKVRPQMSTERSISSISQWKPGRRGLAASTSAPALFWR